MYKYTFLSIYEGQLILHRSVFFKPSRSAQHYTVVQPFTLAVQVPCALIRSEEKQQYTSHHLPHRCLGTSRKDSAQGSTSSPHLGEHWEQQTAQCTEFTSLWPHPTTGRKGHHRESCKACYPDLPDSFHMRTRRQTEPAVVWFKIPFFSPFFSPP